MAIRKSSNTGIPFGGTSGRPANPVNGQPYFNGDIGRLELYTSATGWQNIVQETPGVASATGHYYESDGQGIFVISGTNFVSGAIAYAIGNNGIEYQASTTTYNSLVQLTATFSNLSPAYEPYDIKVVNPSNLFGLLPDAFYINDNPVWSTTAGSLGTLANGSVSIQLASTDDESESRTYALSSGTLPNGLSLSSSGLISGTMSANPATYSFTVTVSDGTNAPVSRSFSISVPAPVVTGGTLTSDSTYYYRTFTGSGSLVVSNNLLTSDILVVGGGGGGGSTIGGGGGAGGYKNQSLTITTGTHTVTIGGGGSGASSRNVQASNGLPTSVGSLISSLGGGGGGSYSTSAASGGSGGGGASNGAGTPGAAKGLGTVGQGNDGGNGLNNVSDQSVGAGGGGAGGAGQDSSTNRGGSGGGAGIGIQSSISGTATVYAGGGNGGGHNGGAGPGYGGQGGPFLTTGWKNTGVNTGTNGVVNTGSGGGGGAYDANDFLGGTGGSGIVVIRYTKASVGG